LSHTAASLRAAISGACKRTLGINVPGDGRDLSGVSRSLRRFINLLPALVARNVKPFIPIWASRRTHSKHSICGIGSLRPGHGKAFIVFEQTLSMDRFESETMEARQS
jgi:hypothetical protein